PQPEPPPGFRDAPRVARLVRQFQALAAPPSDVAATAEPAVVPAPPAVPEVSGKPVFLVRTCVASLQNSRAVGPLVAAEAQTRRFFDAPRQAFLGDGQHYNWRIQRTRFPHFVAIADFLHVLCYL